MSKEAEKDDRIDQVRTVLRPYEVEHPDARIDVKRQNSVSIRIRVLDPAFHGVPREERHGDIWKLLETLPEDVFCDITVLLVLTPEEAKTSLVNLEFENPIPSRL